MKPRRSSPEICPVCGEDVPPNSAACPECGACHESGWNEDAATCDALDLPDAAYEDDDSAPRPAPHRDGPPRFWRWVAFIVVLLLFATFWEWIIRVLTTPWF